MEEMIAKYFEEEQKRIKESLIPELIAFVTPYFPSEEKAKEFITECEEFPDPTPKRVLHQIHRHISLSDEMTHLRTGSIKDSFQVFFWVITIEAIFKASTPYSKKQKVEIVRDFFKCNIDEEDQQTLIKSIAKHDEPIEYTTIEIVADMFNTVRNMIAHEGIYWMFSFPEKEGDDQISIIPKPKTSFLSTYTMGEENLSTYSVSITKDKVRHMIIKGSLNYLNKVLQEQKKS